MYISGSINYDPAGPVTINPFQPQKTTPIADPLSQIDQSGDILKAMLKKFGQSSQQASLLIQKSNSSSFHPPNNSHENMTDVLRSAILKLSAGGSDTENQSGCFQNPHEKLSGIESSNFYF